MFSRKISFREVQTCRHTFPTPNESVSWKIFPPTKLMNDEVFTFSLDTDLRTSFNSMRKVFGFRSVTLKLLFQENLCLMKNFHNLFFLRRQQKNSKAFEFLKLSIWKVGITKKFIFNWKVWRWSLKSLQKIYEKKKVAWTTVSFKFFRSNFELISV